MSVLPSITNHQKIKADIVVDLTQGSGLVIPLTPAGVYFVAAVQGQRICGAVFTRRATAELLVNRAIRDGIAVRVESDTAEGNHDAA
jgi:hypothetical protein